MKCRDFVAFILEYLEGGLGDAEREVFEAHIEDCPGCGTYLDTYRDTVRLEMSCAEHDEVPADVPEALVQAILAARRAGSSS